MSSLTAMEGTYENGSSTYQISDYHGYFDEDMITIITPVTNSYFVKGYLLIHKPVSHLDEECKTLLLPVYITASVFRRIKLFDLLRSRRLSG